MRLNVFGQVLIVAQAVNFAQSAESKRCSYSSQYSDVHRLEWYGEV